MLDKASVLILLMLFQQNSITGLATPLLPPLFDERDIGSTITGVVFTIFSVSFTLISIVAGKIVDSVGHKKVILIAATLMFVTTISYGFLIHL